MGFWRFGGDFALPPLLGFFFFFGFNRLDTLLLTSPPFVIVNCNLVSRLGRLSRPSTCIPAA